MILFTLALLEGIVIAKGWQQIEEVRGKQTVAMLKDDYVPGDMNFDPLNFRPAGSFVYGEYSPEFVDLRNKELQNGRLAMIGGDKLFSNNID
jgi:hypothetical protein